jgi:hypothetical protein
MTPIKNNLERYPKTTQSVRSVSIGVKPLLLLLSSLVPATTRGQLVHSSNFAAKEKPVREDVEWLWQYTPDKDNPDGRENDLVQDLRFRPFLDQFLTTPQTFWGQPSDGKYRSLASTALDYLSVPGKVTADENRYVAISGCVVHFCPARGLLWLDLNSTGHHLVVFAAIDWIAQGKPATDPAAEYTLWLFPDEPLTIASAGSPASPTQRVPPALIRSIARWTAEPLPGSSIVENITHAILVDPDGTPHEVAPSALGVVPPPAPKSP